MSTLAPSEHPETYAGSEVSLDHVPNDLTISDTKLDAEDLPIKVRWSQDAGSFKLI